MHEIVSFFNNKVEVESILLYSTSLFIIVSLILSLLTIQSRYSKIRIKNLEIKYNPVIENMLMAVLFMESDYEMVKDNPEFCILFKKKLFREQMIVSMINLHQNYGGIYAGKLEKFYSDSGLTQDSFFKLKEKKWEVRCKGIKELAELNVFYAFDELVKLINSENRTIAITAINACVKLDPIKGMIQLINHKHPIDDWTQLNIIDALKRGNIENVAGIEFLLTSENNSVVSLGLKIIQSFQMSYHIAFVEELIASTGSKSLKNEALKVVERLSH
jgi:hypothetical protein